ncbi:MAG TPA: nucleoside deaminase [Tepidisphaeraceae bacterium]
MKEKNQAANAAASAPPVDHSAAGENGNASHVGNGVDPFLRAAIDEARVGLSEGGLPIGSVLVRGGKIIGRGHNRRVQKNDPMAHAEIDCLSNAGRQTSYKDTVLYSTLMPCHLCSGAIVQFGIPRVIVGESANFGGAPDFLKAHGVECRDLHDPDCTKMMSEFIRSHADLWHEDIGK